MSIEISFDGSDTILQFVDDSGQRQAVTLPRQTLRTLAGGLLKALQTLEEREPEASRMPVPMMSVENPRLAVHRSDAGRLSLEISPPHLPSIILQLSPAHAQHLAAQLQDASE